MLAEDKHNWMIIDRLMTQQETTLARYGQLVDWLNQTVTEIAQQIDVGVTREDLDKHNSESLSAVRAHGEREETMIRDRAVALEVLVRDRFAALDAYLRVEIDELTSFFREMKELHSREITGASAESKERDRTLLQKLLWLITIVGIVGGIGFATYVWINRDIDTRIDKGLKEVTGSIIKSRQELPRPIDNFFMVDGDGNKIPVKVDHPPGRK